MRWPSPGGKAHSQACSAPRPPSFPALPWGLYPPLEEGFVLGWQVELAPPPGGAARAPHRLSHTAPPSADPLQERMRKGHRSRGLVIANTHLWKYKGLLKTQFLKRPFPPHQFGKGGRRPAGSLSCRYQGKQGLSQQITEDPQSLLLADLPASSPCRGCCKSCDPCLQRFLGRRERKGCVPEHPPTIRRPGASPLSQPTGPRTVRRPVKHPPCVHSPRFWSKAFYFGD